MPLPIPVAPTPSAPTYATDRATIRREAAKILGFYLAGGTTDSATASTITATSSSNPSGGGSLRSSLVANDVLKGAYLLMTSGPEAGNFRRISTNATGTGTATVDEAWHTGPTVSGGDTFEVYGILSPTEWGECIDVGLTRAMSLFQSPITLVPDGDMDTPGTSAWSSVNATIAKSVSDPVSEGYQSLIVTNGAADGYAQSSAVPAVPGQGYWLAADFRCVGSTLSTARLAVWDLTNDEVIFDSNVSGADPIPGVNYAGGMINFGFVVPSDCYQFAVRLIGAESGAVLAWDDVIVNNHDQSRMTATAWVQNRNQIDSVLRRLGSNPRNYTFQDVGWPLNTEEVVTGVTAFRFDIPGGLGSSAIFVHGVRPYGPMGDDADSATTACPLEWAKYVTAKVAYERYGVAIEAANTGRLRQDQMEVERTVISLNKLYMPFRESRVGFKRPWAGMQFSRPFR